ncbi:hypothetical protein FDECE_6741 [Fusarium decemcellulare]|nr:hypothetical protein FDECE_6741 [Fusarium decemcellulare]
MPYPLWYALEPSEIGDDQEPPSDRLYREVLEDLVRAHNGSRIGALNAEPAKTRNDIQMNQNNSLSSHGRLGDSPVEFEFGKNYDKASEKKSLKDALRKGLSPDKQYAQEEIKPKSIMWSFWNTLLHRALFHRDFHASEILFQHGANPDIVNARGQTPLHVAIEFSRVDVVEYLVTKKASLNKLAKTTALDGQGAYTDRLYSPFSHTFIATEWGLRNAHAKGLWHPLHLALLAGNMAIMRLLVEAGSDVNHTTDSAWSMLDLALLARNKSAIGMLWEKGAILSPPEIQSDDEIDSAKSMMEARALASWATTSDLVPQPHLWGIYRHVLALTNVPRQPKDDCETILTLVRKFFDNLHRIAGVDPLGPNPTLCNSCIDLQTQLSEPDDQWLAQPVFKLHQSKSELRDCAKDGCHLCCRVLSKLKDGTQLRDLWTRLGEPMMNNPPDYVQS